MRILIKMRVDRGAAQCNAALIQAQHAVNPV